MAKSRAKPKPNDHEALFLIWVRRKRAKDVMNTILHGISWSDIKMPKASLLLDYLTNMIMCLEMMLKLLSGDWESHKVATMFETITGKPYPDLALMDSLKAAIMDQKYLLSPAAGIVDHIPELEELYDILFREIKDKYKHFYVWLDEDLPDNFGQYLLANVERFYETETVTLRPGANAAEAIGAQMQSFQADVERIKSCLRGHLSKGHKLKLFEGSARALI